MGGHRADQSVCSGPLLMLLGATLLHTRSVLLLPVLPCCCWVGLHVCSACLFGWLVVVFGCEKNMSFLA